MGTPAFAVPSLQAVAEVTELVCVYTRADAISGRGARLRPSPVKQAAEELGIEVRQPATLRDPAEHAALRTIAPDIVVVAAYGLILPREVLEVPRHGCLNVHASLLPRWRGAAPVQHAILSGDDVTGVSIMRMEEGLDTGPFCVTESVDVDGKNVLGLTEELAQAGATALRRALAQLASDGCNWISQDESLATYANKISKSDVALAPALDAREASLRIRASSPQAPSRILIEGRGLAIVESTVADDDVAAGTAQTDSGRLLLGFEVGAIEALRIRPDGKSEMTPQDWLRGARLPTQARWEAVT